MSHRIFRVLACTALSPAVTAAARMRRVSANRDAWIELAILAVVVVLLIFRQAGNRRRK
jgi:hypothetical protein